MRINSVLNFRLINNNQTKSISGNNLNAKTVNYNPLKPFNEYGLHFTASAAKPVYILKKDVGLIEKFDNIKFAQEKYGLSAGRIYNSPVFIDDETVCMYGNSLESKDRNNETYLDEQKVDEMFKAIGWKGISHAIYAIKADGEYVKYPSSKQAASALGVPIQSIQQIITDEFYTSKNYTFVRAVDFEVGKNRDKINEKLYKVALSRFSLARKQPIYAADVKTGNVTYYETANEAVEATGATKNAINAVISKSHSQIATKNLVFMRVCDAAQKGEYGEMLLDEDGKPIPDMEKINKAREKAFDGTKCPIVAISEDKKLRFFNSSKEIIEELGVVPSILSRSLNGIPRASKGYVYVRYRDVLLRDRKGNAVFDEENKFILDKEEIKKIYIEAFLKQ